jgi:hypothetical protein
VEPAGKEKCDDLPKPTSTDVSKDKVVGDEEKENEQLAQCVPA